MPDVGRPLRTWTDQCGWAARHAVSWAGRYPYFGTAPVLVRLHFALSRPRRPKADLPLTKPDLDKLARAVLDAFTGILYADDAQVTSLIARKRYGAQPLDSLYVEAELDV